MTLSQELLDLLRQAAIEDTEGPIEENTIKFAQEAAEAPTCNWEELLFAGIILFKSSRDSGKFDRLIIDTIEKAENLGLSSHASPELFLVAEEVLASLYFKYSDFLRANNHLLHLRELQSDERKPKWIDNFSVKCRFKLDIEEAASAPEQIIKRLGFASTNETAPYDDQSVSIFKEFLLDTAALFAAGETTTLSMDSLLSRITNALADDTELFTEDLASLDGVMKDQVVLLASDTAPTLDANSSTPEQTAKPTQDVSAILRLQAEQQKQLIEQLEEQLIDFEIRLGELETAHAERVAESSAMAHIEPHPILGETQTVDELTASELLADRNYLKDVKVLVLGATRLKPSQLHGIAKQFGLERPQLTLELDYDKNKRFDIDKLRYNSPYDGILLGPIAHKVVGLGQYSSILTKLKSEEGFPPTEELRSSTKQLKVTKTGFRSGLQNLLIRIKANQPTP